MLTFSFLSRFSSSHLSAASQQGSLCRFTASLPASRQEPSSVDSSSSSRLEPLFVLPRVYSRLFYVSRSYFLFLAPASSSSTFRVRISSSISSSIAACEPLPLRKHISSTGNCNLLVISESWFLPAAGAMAVHISQSTRDKEREARSKVYSYCISSAKAAFERETSMDLFLMIIAT